MAHAVEKEPPCVNVFQNYLNFEEEVQWASRIQGNESQAQHLNYNA